MKTQFKQITQCFSATTNQNELSWIAYTFGMIDANECASVCATAAAAVRGPSSTELLSIPTQNFVEFLVDGAGRSHGIRIVLHRKRQIEVTVVGLDCVTDF